MEEGGLLHWEGGGGEGGLRLKSEITELPQANKMILNHQSTMYYTSYCCFLSDAMHQTLKYCPGEI